MQKVTLVYFEALYENFYRRTEEKAADSSTEFVSGISGMTTNSCRLMYHALNWTQFILFQKYSNPQLILWRGVHLVKLFASLRIKIFTVFHRTWGFIIVFTRARYLLHETSFYLCLGLQNVSSFQVFHLIFCTDLLSLCYISVNINLLYDIILITPNEKYNLWSTLLRNKNFVVNSYVPRPLGRSEVDKIVIQK